MYRAFLRTILIACTVVSAFGLGGLFAARFLAHPGDGLAGGATVTLVALVASAIGLVAGIVLARRLAPNALPRAAAGAALLTALVVMLLGRKPPTPLGSTESPANAEVLGPDGLPLPPPVPPAGTPDSLIALITVHPESLPRLATKEHAYEEPAAMVYGSSGSFYLLALKEGGRAWLHSSATGMYFHLEGLLVNRLSYLTEAWDRSLRDSSEAGAPARRATVKTESREIPANVVEALRNSRGELWLRVEILESSPCEGSGGTPKVIDTGWIPAYGKARELTAWFYSRGC